jgi:hypothetical protein
MTNPVFASGYGGNLTETSLIVESQNTGRSKVLSAEDYVSVTYYDYQDNRISAEEYQVYMMYGLSSAVYADYGASAESALLSAFLSVTNTNPVAFGISDGYGEPDNASLSGLLDFNSYIVQKLNLLTDEIPSDMDFILLNAPNSDLSEPALAKLDAWLDNGGEYGKTLIFIPLMVPVETPRLDSFLYDWGIEIGDGYVVQPDENTSIIAGSNRIQHFEPSAGEYSSSLNSNYKIYGELIRPINLVYEAKSNIETKALLTSYDDAFVYPFEEIEGEGNSGWSESTAEKGRLNTAVESRKTRFEEFTPFSSRVIVLGGYFLIDDYFIDLENANNAQFFMNIVNFISGKDGAVTLTHKSFSVASFSINAEQSKVIGFIFALAFPLVIIVAGVAIWLKRRYR